MKEYPILFNTEMVRAILDGRKWQTRRVIKPPNGMQILSEDNIYWDDDAEPPSGDGTYRGCAIWECDDMGGSPELLACPYGQPGDTLWVRETFACLNPDLVTIDYKADGVKLRYPQKWKPSIYMPRWASRISIGIKDIRVERVQDITYENARAEGVTTIENGAWKDYYPQEISYNVGKKRHTWGENDRGCGSPILSFRSLWDSINAKRGFGWEINPWVWVIEFDRITTHTTDVPMVVQANQDLPDVVQVYGSSE